MAIIYDGGTTTDWASPFRRTGAFPLDSTNIFNTLTDFDTYAKTGGTAYVGQICAVISEKSIYLITGTNAYIKIGEMTISGAVNSDDNNPISSSAVKVYVDAEVVQLTSKINSQNETIENLNSAMAKKSMITITRWSEEEE